MQYKQWKPLSWNIAKQQTSNKTRMARLKWVHLNRKVLTIWTENRHLNDCKVDARPSLGGELWVELLHIFSPLCLRTCQGMWVSPSENGQVPRGPLTCVLSVQTSQELLALGIPCASSALSNLVRPVYTCISKKNWQKEGSSSKKRATEMRNTNHRWEATAATCQKGRE